MQKQTISANTTKNKNNPKSIEVAVRMRPLLNLLEDEQVWRIDYSNNIIESISNSMNNQSMALNNITMLTNNASMTLGKKNSYNNSKSGMGVQKNNSYQFTSDYTFGQQHNNQEIYTTCCQKITSEFIEHSKNGTIFMYGQTTSGKTYTMLGDKHTQGLIAYSLQDICSKLSNNSSFQLTISYYQIYNEQINDLLKSGSVNLKIIDDKVYGAEQIYIQSFEDAIQLLQIGEEQRSYSEKKYHDHSSRSHTIFQINKVDIKTGAIKSTLNLVDLAGSQRITDQDSNQQTGYINKSLFVLSNVIHRLASSKKNTHIPFRDSKLTRVLAPSLTGSSSTIVICTISPASINFYQTLSTLRFASCSRKLKLKPKNQSPTYTQASSLSMMQSAEISKLKQENQELQKLLKIQKQNRTKENKNWQSNTFLEEKLNQLYVNFQKTDIKASNKLQETKTQWSNKVTMLCTQYHKNIRTLQKQYTKAMINAISIESGIDRESMTSVLKQFHEI